MSMEAKKVMTRGIRSKSKGRTKSSYISAGGGVLK
jgi:hypothetical protein